MKKLIFLILFNTSFTCFGQQINYLERFRLLERFVGERQINLSGIPPEELADLMRLAVDLNATPMQAVYIQNSVRSLDKFIHSESQSANLQTYAVWVYLPTKQKLY